MKLRKSVACSAVALAFAAGGAIAQSGTERDLSISAKPNVGVDASAGINTDVNTSQSSGQASASTAGSTSAQANTGEMNDEEREKHGKARGHDEDRKTGLDRADEVAGERGKQGRDNARAKQAR